MDNKDRLSTKSDISNLSKLALNVLENKNSNSFDVKKEDNKSKLEYKSINIKSDVMFENHEKDNLVVDYKTVSYNDDELLEFFIGINYDKIYHNSFNFSALLLNFIYFLYRKMYVLSLGMMFLLIVLKFLIRNNIVFFAVYMILSVISGVLFNKLYLFVADYKIKTIKSKLDDYKEIKMKVIRSGGTDLLFTIIFSIVFVIIFIILFFREIIFSLFGVILAKLDFDNVNSNDSYKYNSKNFVTIVEKYNEKAISEIENPGQYLYSWDDVDYNFVAMPFNDEKKDISCTYDKSQDKWDNTKGYEFSDVSSSCADYMKDILNNYNRNYDTSLITDAKIIISNKGKVQDKTFIRYDDVLCKYNKKEFKCTRE